MTRRLRLTTSLMAAALMLLGACSRTAETTEDGTEEVLGNEVSIADARLTISSDRDTVTVNGTELASGNVQDAAAGDAVMVDSEGTALITAESVFQIEGLRGATLTVPDLTKAPLNVPLEAGHVFVRLNPDANATLVIDAGERQFTTRSADAEFALCQAPDGASCLAVLQGEVEWNEKGVATETYVAGEASFAGRGNAPDPPRCADEATLGDMQRSLRGLDFAGALKDIVAEWEPCEEGAEPVEEAAEATLPSAAGMIQVVAETIQVGSPTVSVDTPNLLAPRTLDGSASFYIEPVTVTNAGFRSWIVGAAGDDADAWRRYAPADWLARAPAGAATQSTYAADTADDAVTGVTYETAGLYCASQGKRLATEVEWELAAVGSAITDLGDEAQDWVSDWEAYGPGPEDTNGRQVLRGANNTLVKDQYFRVFAPEAAEATAARQHARIRCAADEVAVGGRSFATTVVEDDFNGLGWPLVEEGGFALDYHPENYHLDVSNQHAQLTVVRALGEPLASGRVDVDMFIERNNTGTGQGAHRFGAVVGTAEQLYTLTVQPDELTGTSFAACLVPLEPDVLAALKLAEEPVAADNPGRVAAVPAGANHAHYNENCDAAAKVETVPVTTIDSPLRLSLVMTDGKMEAWVNEVLVDTATGLPGLGMYGFFSENYHRPRSHIHFDSITVSTD